MSHLIFNMKHIDFHNTLGVTAYACRLAQALSKHYKVHFIVSSIDAFNNSDWCDSISESISGVYDLNNYRKIGLNKIVESIEILPHHFQKKEFCPKAITICHDLHIYTIPWKYNDIESRRQKFKNNIIDASAVVTHFQGTYFELERAIGADIKNLYITPSPILLELNIDGAPLKFWPSKGPIFVYPTQLQAHKGHIELINAIEKFINHGNSMQLLLPGSDFQEETTNGLKALIEQKNLHKNVHLLGRISESELIHIYNNCDGLIVPSKAEGGGYVAMEGIAKKLPVAVNDIPAAKMHLDAVRAEVFWFNVENEDSICDALSYLSKSDRIAIAQKNEIARGRILSMTWVKVAAMWQVVIDYVLEGGNRPIQSMDANGWNLEIAK